VPKIAAALRISKVTLERMSKRNAAVRDALERGRAQAESMVAQSAYEMATSGRHPIMTRFWLQARAQWRTTTRVELVGADGGPLNVAAMTPEQRKAELKRLDEIAEKCGDD
jgi:hypothetical protein